MMLSDLNDVNSDQYLHLRELVLDWNESLRDAGAKGAERAFGLGCGIGLAPALIIILILFILRMINVILASMLVIIAILALIGLSSLGAYYAQLNNMRRVYNTDIEPEIRRLLVEYDMDRVAFDTLIYPMLPEKAPLSLYLSPLIPPEQEDKADDGEILLQGKESR